MLNQSPPEMQRPHVTRLLAASVAAWVHAAPSVAAEDMFPWRANYFPPATAPQLESQHGLAVAADGNRIVVGAPATDVGTHGRSGQVYVYDAGTGGLLLTLANPRPGRDQYFGASVSISGSIVAVGTNASSSGAVCIFDLQGPQPAVPVMIIEEPEPGKQDRFGAVVAVSGHHLLAGAPYNDTGAEDAGAVYLYDLQSATPTVPALKIPHPGPARWDNFGSALAIAGSRVVIGASRDDGTGSSNGSAWVFDLDHETPAVPAWHLTFDYAAGQAGFGYAVAVSGARVAIGAPGARRALIFDLESAVPDVPVLILRNPQPTLPDSFGNSVALRGNVLLVGSERNFAQLDYSGGVFVFNLSGLTPEVPQLTLESPTAVRSSGFGHAVAFAGERIIVGQPAAFPVSGGITAAWLFDPAGALPELPVAPLIHPGRNSRSYYGSEVAMSGDLLAVSMSWSDEPVPNSGSVLIYDLAGSTPSVPRLHLKNPEPDSDEFFGSSLAMSGSRLVVGVPFDETGAIAAGRAYVFDVNGPTPATPVVILVNPAPVSLAFFGQFVAVEQNIVVVGAPGSGHSSESPGAVYVYDLDSSTPAAPVLTLTGTGHFGYSVAVSGRKIVVGASLGGTAGSAFLYDLDNANPLLPVMVFQNPEPTSLYSFGSAVAVSGEHVCIGGWSGSGGGGMIYLYDLRGEQPQVSVATISDPEPGKHYLFGAYLQMAGPYILAGAGANYGAGTDTGAIYGFLPASTATLKPVFTLRSSMPGDIGWFGNSFAMSGHRLVAGMSGNDTVNFDEGAISLFGEPPGPPGPMVAWRAEKFGAQADNPVIAGSLADPDGDGVCNLLEYTLGGEPGVASARVLPVVAELEGRLELRFGRDAALTDLTCTVQASSTPEVVASWVTLATSTGDQPFIAMQQGVTVSETGEGFLKQVVVRDFAGPNAAARRFLRLRVSR